jgi:carboxyl-terminal processing protease
MLPACNRGAGANIHTPDVCLTLPPVPPVPIPYVNTAFNATAVSFVPHVFVCGLNAHNLGTILATSTGDERGFVHWTIVGWSKYIVGNPIVNVGMLPGENLTCASIGNKGNAPSGACLVPSAVNVFYTDASAPTGDAPEPLPLVGDAAERGVDVDRDGDLVAVAVRTITPAAPLLVRRALRGASTVVLDLRGNPGGDLDAAVRIVELFLPAGSLVAVVEDAYGHRTERRTRGRPAFGGPVEVWVDRGTASAAEVVAAALRDHGRAEVVGGPTWGKGTVAAARDGVLTTIGVVRSPSGHPMGGVAAAQDELVTAETSR